MREIVLILILSLCLADASAQKEDNQWYFSHNRALSFVSGEAVVVNGSDMWATEASASIADGLGNLLFYTNGKDVWNASNLIMPNGADLNSSTTPTQVVIVPWPEVSDKYIIFHFTAPQGGSWNPPTGLNYSVVDMDLDNGLGDIAPGQREITVITDMLSERLMAVKHGDGLNWWIIAHNMGVSYSIIPVTGEGVGIPVSQAIGNDLVNISGEMEISPDGEKLVTVDIEGFINVLDFDRCEGVLSNPVDLSKVPVGLNNSFYGCAFSSDSELLYVGENHFPVILQYDLSAFDIAASEDTIFNGDSDYGIGALQLAPDGSVYFGLVNTGLGKIEEPDILGIGCNAFQTSLYSGNIYSLPTMPNYNLGVKDCSPSGLLDYQGYSVSIYPNPMHGQAVITWEDIRPSRLELRDLSGRVVLSKDVSGVNDRVLINSADLTPGVLMLQLFDQRNVIAVERLVVTGR